MCLLIWIRFVSKFPKVMKTPQIIVRHIMKELFLHSLFAVAVITFLLVMANLLRHEDSVFWILRKSDQSLVGFIVLLVPYTLSMAIPFGFAVALSFSLGKWSSSREILALNSLGVGNLRLSLPIIAYSFLISVLSLFSALQWGPINRAYFDSLRDDLAWENVSIILERDGEITFNLNGADNESTASSIFNIAGVDGFDAKKITLSVAKTNDYIWRNLRISVYGESDQPKLVLNALEARIDRDLERGLLRLFPQNVDIESIDDEKTFYFGADSTFVSFRKLSEPLEFKIGEGKRKNIKRLGFFELLNVANETSDPIRSKQARDILGKNSALGFSPMFISFLILPFSIKFGRKDSFYSLVFGILICITYFVLGTVCSNLCLESKYSSYVWWSINILFLVSLFLFKSKGGFE